jgi:hypothetical protein
MLRASLSLAHMNRTSLSTPSFLANCERWFGSGVGRLHKRRRAHSRSVRRMSSRVGTSASRRLPPADSNCL